eukprot:gene48391-64921_t
MDGRDYLMISGRDVSAAEQARMEHEAILHNALIGVALTREQHFMMVNPRFEQMLGWPPGLLVGQPGRLVWPSEADYRAVDERISAKLARGEQVEIEQTLKRRDGSQFLCRLLAKAVDPSHPSRGGTIWLAEDITERRQVEHALAKARDDAEAASRAKSAFLAAMSHELRTPLNGVIGYAQVLMKDRDLTAKNRERLRVVQTSGEHLLRMINEVLDFSKIEAGRMGKIKVGDGGEARVHRMAAYSPGVDAANHCSASGRQNQRAIAAAKLDACGMPHYSAGNSSLDLSQDFTDHAF